MDTLTQDLRYALRSLRRSRGVTLAAVLTLGLGMGASTAVFALLKRAVLDPLPYRESSRLVRLKNRVSGVGPGVEWDMSTAQYFYLREHATSLAAIGIYQTGGTNVAGQGGPERAVATVCNAGLLRLLGAPAAVGRLFDERDDALQSQYLERRIGARVVEELGILRALGIQRIDHAFDAERAAEEHAQLAGFD